MKLFTTAPQETFNKIIQKDWSRHPLGPISDWDPALLSTLNLILNSKLPNFIYWGPDFHCFYNDASIAILGDKHPDALGENGSIVWARAWENYASSHIVSAMKGTPHADVDQKMLIMKDNNLEERYFTYGHTPIFGLDGIVKGVLSRVVETTESVMARHTLARNADQMAQVMDLMNIGFFDWDIVQDEIYFNPKMQSDWGLGGDLNFNKCMNVVHPEDRERAARVVQEAFQNRDRYEDTYRIIRKGCEVWINVRGIIHFDGEVPARLFGTSVDITEEVRAGTMLQAITKALEHEKFKLNTMFEQMPTAMALWRGENMVFEQVNPNFQQIFPNHELVGKPLLEAVPELRDQPFPSLIQEVFRTGVTFQAREMLARIPDRPNGSTIDHYFDFSYIQIKDADGKPYGVLVHTIDVTESVRAKKQLLEEQTLREKFLATMTHDLGNKLSVVRLTAKFLEKQSDPDLIKKFLTKISAHTVGAEKLIRNMLDASRLRLGGKLNLEMKVFDLVKVTKDVVSELEILNDERVRVKASVQEILGHWDEQSIKRVLENLIVNALKYGDKSKSVDVSVSANDEQAKLVVHNFGNVIPEKEQALIFDLYHRSPSTFKDLQGGLQGWGIGLSLVKGLVEAHDGSITVISNDAEGTRFEVSLPIKMTGLPEADLL